MLYFNYKMSAKEAADVGFVAQTYNQDTIGSIWQDLKAQAKLPIKVSLPHFEPIRDSSG